MQCKTWNAYLKHNNNGNNNLPEDLRRLKYCAPVTKNGCWVSYKDSFTLGKMGLCTRFFHNFGGPLEKELRCCFPHVSLSEIQKWIQYLSFHGLMIMLKNLQNFSFDQSSILLYLQICTYTKRGKHVYFWVNRALPWSNPDLVIKPW